MSPVIHDPTGVASTVPCVQVMNLPEDSEEAHEVSQQEAGRNVGRTSNMGGGQGRFWVPRRGNI